MAAKIKTGEIIRLGQWALANRELLEKDRWSYEKLQKRVKRDLKLPYSGAALARVVREAGVNIEFSGGVKSRCYVKMEYALALEGCLEKTADMVRLLVDKIGAQHDKEVIEQLGKLHQAFEKMRSHKPGQNEQTTEN